MSLDDDKRVVLDGIKTLGVDALMWREEQYGANDERCHWHDENSAIAALDRILAALDDAISERDSAYALLTDKQGTLDAAEERARVAEAERDIERKVAEDLAESLIDGGWCRPDVEREYAPCQEDGETCPECAYAAAREAVESDPTEYGQTRIVPVDGSE